MKRSIEILSVIVLGSILFHTDVSLAQVAEPFAYPSQEQSQEQQQQDHYACYSWAKQQTGVDPSQPDQISPATAAQSSQQGQLLRASATGALLGTVGGAIAGNTGEGAAIGAGVGALAGLFREREEQQQAEQAQVEATQEENQRLQTYYRAWTACMEGRGYSVQ